MIDDRPVHHFLAHHNEGGGGLMLYPRRRLQNLVKVLVAGSVSKCLLVLSSPNLLLDLKDVDAEFGP